MRRDYHTPRLITEINITPFTDVILVLLIIFMITTPLILQSSIKVVLPEASTKDFVNDPKPLHITVTSEGIIYFGKELVTRKELKRRVEVLLKKDNRLNVVLFSDQSARFKMIVSVMDVLNELGVKNFSIATKPNQ